MYRILVADDERWIRRGIIKMIESGNDKKELEIFEADNISDALEVYKEKLPQIIVSDVRFPVDDGCLLCETIYAMNPQIKFIMVSGYDEFEYVKRALSYKAVDYLLKPVDKQILNETIRKCMKEIISDAQSEISRVTEDVKEAAAPGDMKEIVMEVIKNIRKDYKNRFSLPELAAKYHLSEAYFSSAFKKVSGTSLTLFIMQIRVEKAIDLMMTTDYRFNDIAKKVGYTDQHYFTKVFKKMTDMSPREYKLKLEQELTGDLSDETTSK